LGLHRIALSTARDVKESYAREEQKLLLLQPEEN
jgi:hypothetical protein